LCNGSSTSGRWLWVRVAQDEGREGFHASISGQVALREAVGTPLVSISGGVAMGTPLVSISGGIAMGTPLVSISGGNTSGQRKRRNCHGREDFCLAEKSGVRDPARSEKVA